jgi:hypothetical protein
MATQQCLFSVEDRRHLVTMRFEAWQLPAVTAIPVAELGLLSVRKFAQADIALGTALGVSESPAA